MSVIGWKLDRDDRAALLRRFPPRWPDEIADHVTLDAHASDGGPLPAPVAGEIVGQVDDGEGLQAMIARVDGTTSRPDGGTYHITWSLDRGRGRQAVQSNEVIARLGWTPLDEAVPIRLVPARLE
jgi:hypothetical protein